MATLPTVGGDVGVWGDELNEYLSVEHNPDGTHTTSVTDPDLVAIAGLSPSNDDLLQRKAGAWTNRTPAQVKTDLVLAKADVGLGSADNTSDASKPVSTAQQTALDLKAPLASPAFTGTPTGVTKSHVGLGSVDNTADTAKPVSTAQQTALDLKAPLASPTFTTSIVTPIVAGDGTTVKLRPEGAADDDGELRVTKAAAGTKLTFTSETGSTADVNLYRSGVDALKTDNNLSIVGGISALNGTANEVALGIIGPGAQPAIRFSGDTTLYRGAAGSLRTQGDLVTEGVLFVGSDINFYTDTKKLIFSTDTNLYRSAADTLKTDDSLEIVGTLTVGGLPVTGGAGGASFVSSFKWGVDA